MKVRAKKKAGFLATGVAGAAIMGMLSANADTIEREDKPPINGVQVLSVDLKKGEIEFRVPGMDDIQRIPQQGVTRIVIDREEATAPPKTEPPKPEEKPAEPPKAEEKPKPEEKPAEPPKAEEKPKPEEKPAGPTPGEKLLIEIDDILGLGPSTPQGALDEKLGWIRKLAKPLERTIGIKSQTPGKQFYSNLPKAIETMQGALKDNPELQKDAGVWFPLGALYGSIGCDSYGDTNCTKEELELRVHAIGCLNRAWEADERITKTSLWGNSFNDWYAGIMTTCTDLVGVNRGDIGTIFVDVNPDGSLTPKKRAPKTKTEGKAR